MSALNADPAGPSRYLRSKGEAEAAVVASGLDWTIFQPSVIFGREDAFLNLFATLLRVAAGDGAGRAPDARFQPVYVGDVARLLRRARSPTTRRSARSYPLCGPKVYTLRELVALRRRGDRHVRPDRRARPDAVGALQACVLEHAAGHADEPRQSASMQRDSVCDCPFPAVFGIAPAALEALAPTYLAPDAMRSRYDRIRAQRRALTARGAVSRAVALRGRAGPLTCAHDRSASPPDVKIYRVGGSVRDELLGRAGRRSRLGRRRRDARRC